MSRHNALRQRQDDGFTLLELLIVLVILPLIIGGIATAVIAELDNTSQGDPLGAYTRLANSHDAQITSAYFVRDVESAASVSTASSPVLCHPSGVTAGNQILGLEWPSAAAQAAGDRQYDVSYFVLQTSPAELIRYYCVGGTYTSQSVVSHDVFKSLTSISLAQYPSCDTGSSCAVSGGKVYAFATVTCTDGSVTCANGGLFPVIPAAHGDTGVVDIKLNVTDNQTTQYQYALTAVPRLANTVVNGNPSSAPANAPFISNGKVSGVGQCTILANGLAAINQATGTALSLTAQAALEATYLNTLGGSISGSGTYPSPVLHDGAIPSPYDVLKEPPTVPAGATYTVHTITAHNWSPSGSLPAGIYIVTDGMSITGNSGLDASAGVLFYVTNGSVAIGGGGNILMNALSPNWEKTTDGSSAPLPEVVLWISSSDTAASLTLGGNGGAVTINGAIYAPTATVTLNGGGNSGGISTQSLTGGSITCDGGGHVPLNVTVGSPLSSGTRGVPATNPINIGQTDRANITVLGTGHLAPTGTVSVWECGPETLPSTPPGCTKSTVGAVKVATALNLTPDSTNGTATATSPLVTPTLPGWYCFATYYSGDVSYLASSDTTLDACFMAPPPAVAITSPTSPIPGCYATAPTTTCPGTWDSSTAITGTSADPGGSGIQQVTVTVEDPTGKYWDGTSFASSTAVQVPATTADGWLNWHLSFPVSNFPTGDTGSYAVTATATDQQGFSSSPAQDTFTWNG